MSLRDPLAILLVSEDPARLRTALTLARAEVALGGTAHIFLQGEAAPLLRNPVTSPRDADWLATGEPNLATLFDEALEDGVAISLCQSGLAMAKIKAQEVDPRLIFSGPVAFLAAITPGVRLLSI